MRNAFVYIKQHRLSFLFGGGLLALLAVLFIILTFWNVAQVGGVSESRLLLSYCILVFVLFLFTTIRLSERYGGEELPLFNQRLSQKLIEEFRNEAKLRGIEKEYDAWLNAYPGTPTFKVTIMSISQITSRVYQVDDKRNNYYLLTLSELFTEMKIEISTTAIAFIGISLASLHFKVKSLYPYAPVIWGVTIATLLLGACCWGSIYQRHMRLKTTLDESDIPPLMKMAQQKGRHMDMKQWLLSQAHPICRDDAFNWVSRLNDAGKKTDLPPT